jgi:hypothetical protein
MSDKLLRILAESFKEEINSHTAAITGGTLKSFDEYRYQTGVLQGLALALAHVKDLARKIYDDDD